MPIKKKVVRGDVPTPTPSLPPYEPVRTQVAITGIPALSTHNLDYFFNLAESLYKDALPAEAVDTVNNPPPAYSSDISSPNEVGLSSVLVLQLFRQTLTHIRPVTERFHLGAADRQPLYALTAQPSPRSAGEFNELSIKRRHPISGVCHSVCTSDIEPRLDLARPGHYKVASLTMDAVPVWKHVVSGQVTFEAFESGRGNKLCIWWGDRNSLGPIGDTYGLWWESGGDAGSIEAFYVVQWGGFESSDPGVVRVKPARKDANNQLVDPRSVRQDIATLYFHGDGKAQFVCQDMNTQIRLDFIIAGLMTVLTLETRKAEATGTLGAHMARMMGLNLVQ